MTSQAVYPEPFSVATTLHPSGTSLIKYSWFRHPRNGAPTISRTEEVGEPYTGSWAPGQTVVFDTHDEGMQDCTNVHIEAHNQTHAIVEYMRPLVEYDDSIQAWQSSGTSANISRASTTPSLTDVASGTLSPSSEYAPAPTWVGQYPLYQIQQTDMMFDPSQSGDTSFDPQYDDPGWQAQPWMNNDPQSFGSMNASEKQAGSQQKSTGQAWAQYPKDAAAQSLGGYRR